MHVVPGERAKREESGVQRWRQGGCDEAERAGRSFGAVDARVQRLLDTDVHSVQRPWAGGVAADRVDTGQGRCARRAGPGFVRVGEVSHRATEVYGRFRIDPSTGSGWHPE